MKVLETLELDSADVEQILSSELLSVSNKNKVLEHVSEDVVLDNADSVKHLVCLLNGHPQFRVSPTLLDGFALHGFPVRKG